MDSTPGFECSNVQALVLDEADRCLDLGFSATMDSIIANLPPRRHTMLFSATQSKKYSPSFNA
jgi:ATP-dependent RNA helicase DDX10/DBP4